MMKLRAKMGEVEFDYEGPEEFLRDRLLDLFKELSSLKVPMATTKRPPNHDKGSGAQVDEEDHSVSTVAQQLSVKTGPDLLIAAALSFVLNGSKTFTKKQLREKIRESHDYFKSSYASNFDNYLGRLVKSGRLSHTGGDNYSIPAKERDALVARLPGSSD